MHYAVRVSEKIKFPSAHWSIYFLMVIICWNRRVSRRSQACLTFSLYMEGRWVKIKTREEKLICNPGRHWEILEDSGWINHDVFEPILKRSHWWDSDCGLENQGGGCKAILANGVMSVRQTAVLVALNTRLNLILWTWDINNLTADDLSYGETDLAGRVVWWAVARVRPSCVEFACSPFVDMALLREFQFPVRWTDESKLTVSVCV